MQFNIDDKKLNVRLPNAGEALRLWGVILKKTKEANELENIHGFTSYCMESLERYVDLSEFGISFEDSMNDERFFQAYKDAAELFVTRMMSFFKKKD